MKELPSPIGDIPTLGLISVEFGLFSVQHSLGYLIDHREDHRENYDIKVPVTRLYIISSSYIVILFIYFNFFMHAY